MFEIKVSKEIKDACPVFAGAAVYAAVKNTAYSEGLWQEIEYFLFIDLFLLLFSRMFSVHHVPGKVPGVLFLYTPEEL